MNRDKFKLRPGIVAVALAMSVVMGRAEPQSPEGGAESSESSDLDAILDTEESSAPAEERQESGESQEPAGSEQAQEAPASDQAQESASPEQSAPPQEPEPATIPVASESEPEPVPAPLQSPQGRMIEEIVVTARKRDESLQDAPVVVNALSAEQLERYNVSDMTKIAEMTPQLFVSSGSNGNGGTITMRGIGSSSTTSGFDQAVAINVDGIQYSRATVLHQGYFDVAQVEVLKGPQSLFFGKSSSAGVISLTTADPGPERSIQFKAGNEFEANERWFEGVVSGPVWGDVGARFAARYSSMEGYVENLAPAVTDSSNGATIPAPDRDWPGTRQAMARLTLGYAPGGDFNAKLKLSYVDLQSGGVSQGTEMISCEATGTTQLNPGEECNGDWRVHQNGLPADVAATESIWNHKGGQLYSFYKAHSAVATLNYLFDAYALTSVTGYYQFEQQYIGDYDFTASSIIVGAEHPVEAALSQELRLLSDFDSPLNFMVGGYYQHKQFDFNDNTSRLVPLPVDPATGRYAAYVRDSETTGRAWSVFGQLIWNVTDTIEVAGGARYSDEVKDSFSVHRYLHPLVASTFRPVGDPLEAKTHDTNVSPELTASWKPSDDIMVYGAYKKGFKSGGYSNSAILSRNTTAADETFRPETVGGVEAGIKSSWFDRSLQLNLAAYSYEFKDLQVNFFDAANVNFLTQNAATATTRGVELELRWLPPIEGLDIHGNASYNRAVYGDFLSFCYSGQSHEDGCNLDKNGQPATPGDHQDLSGTIRPIAPEFTASLGLFYRIGLPRSLLLSLSADSGYVDRYLLNPLGRQIYQPAYIRSDASISLSTEAGNWEVALIGRNLSNEYTLYDEGDSPLSGQGTGQHEPENVLADQVGVGGRPREIAVQFTMKFGE